VAGSPHFFAPDGSNVFNPGMEVDWPDGAGKGSPVVEAGDAAPFESLIAIALAVPMISRAP
jgi:hypothetical protein